MKMVTKIACSNMKYHKSKNILIGIAIFLTTLLLFLVPTIGKNMIGAQFALINEIYPSWHALYRNVDTKTVQKLSAHHDVAAWGLRSDAGYAVAGDAQISLLYMDEEGLRLYNIELAEGTLPEKKNEIVVSRGILDELGQTGEIGDTVNIPYQIMRGGGLDYTQEEAFVITGFLEDSTESKAQRVYSALISDVFLQEEVPEDEVRYRFLLQAAAAGDASERDIEETIRELAAQMGISENDIRINSEYLMANYVDPVTIPIIAGIMCIIVLAGIITIYSIYYVGMSDRVQEFGRLKAIGATRRQLKQMVLGEGLAVAAIAIPAGLFVGTLLTKLTFSLLLSLYQKDNAQGTAMQQLLADGKIDLYHPPIYLLAVFITLATVWLSLIRPMKTASRVSEIEAIRYQAGVIDEGKRRKKQRKSYRRISISRLSEIYLMGNKKNSVITTLSMAMTGVFVMVVATVLSCANPRESADNSIVGQYVIAIKTESGNKEHPQREWSNVIRNNPLNEELSAQIKQLDGVTGLSCFREVRVTSEQLGNDVWGIGGVPKEYAGQLIDGITEGSVDYEELKSADKAIIDKNLLYWYPDIKVGDTLSVTVLDGEGERQAAVEVAAIGDYSIGFSNYNYILMAAEGAEKLSGYNINSSYHIFAEEDYNEELAEAFGQMTERNELLQLKTWQAEYEMWSSALATTNWCCYAFLAILGAICVMNMVNTMIHSVHLRKKELGMMQAIGMTDRQLTQMLQMEGLFYTVGTLVISIGCGSLLGYPVFLWARYNGMFSMSRYHYPVAAALIVSGVLFTLQMVLAVALGKSVKKESLIERIRYSE